MKKIIYVDMDDTIAAFLGDERLKIVPIVPTFLDYPEMHEKGFFRNLKPIDGAISALRKLLSHPELDIYICSVPLHTSAHSYSEKVEWIQEHIPELSSKIILTQQKTLLQGDYLIDDSLHWKNLWPNNSRKFIHFNPRLNNAKQWEEICSYFFKQYPINQINSLKIAL